MLQGTLIDELIHTVEVAEQHVAADFNEPASDVRLVLAPVLAYEAPRTEALAGVA